VKSLVLTPRQEVVKVVVHSECLLEIELRATTKTVIHENVHENLEPALEPMSKTR
jgi:hypothetical protein